MKYAVSRLTLQLHPYIHKRVCPRSEYPMKAIRIVQHVLTICCVWLALGSLALAQSEPRVRHLKDFAATDPEVLRNIQSLEIEFEKLEGRTSAPVITALVGSRDGKYIAAAGDDHAIRIVEAETGETIQTVIGHNDWIQSLLFVDPDWKSDVSARENEIVEDVASEPGFHGESPKGDITPELYSAGHDGRVLRWKFTFPLESQEVAIVPYAIRSISVSNEKQLLAIGGFYDEVLLYDLAADKYVQRLKCSSDDQRAVRFSPDGSRVLSGSREGEIIVWDTTTGEELTRYHEHRSRIHTAVFSSDGSWITSAGEDRRLVRYDLINNQVMWSHELALSKMRSLCLVNDYLAAVAGADNRIRLFDTQTNSIVADLPGHLGTVAVMAPCGDRLLSGSFDTTVRLWNLTELEQERVRKSVPTSRTPIKMDAKMQIR